MNEDIEKLLHREDFSLASISRRSWAFLVDELILSFIFIAIIWDYFVQATSMEQIISLTNSFVLEYMALKIIYQTFFVSIYGASIGKMFLKIRIIEMATLDKPSALAAFNRAFVRIFSEMIFYLGFLWGVLNPNKQAWHDLSAKTLVINV